jgi:hypothetical protein
VNFFVLASGSSRINFITVKVLHVLMAGQIKVKNIDYLCIRLSQQKKKDIS